MNLSLLEYCEVVCVRQAMLTASQLLESLEPQTRVVASQLAETIVGAEIWRQRAVAASRIHNRDVVWNYLTHACCFASGATVSLAARKWIWPKRFTIQQRYFACRKHAAAAPSGLKISRVLHREGYAVGFDDNLKTARWVSFIMCRNSLSIAAARDNNVRLEVFAPDPDVPDEARSSASDYTSTGFDRGHLAPRASVAFSETSAAESFYLSNVALQHPDVNRRTWRQLEACTRAWTKRHPGPTAVVVGPMFGKSEPSRVNGVAVPTAFYMAVMHCYTRRTIAFVVPNEALSKKDREQVRSAQELVDKYAVTVSSLEAKLSKENGAQAGLFGGVRLFHLMPRKYRLTSSWFPWSASRSSSKINRRFWAVKPLEEISVEASK